MFSRLSNRQMHWIIGISVVVALILVAVDGVMLFPTKFVPPASPSIQITATPLNSFR